MGRRVASEETNERFREAEVLPTATLQQPHQRPARGTLEFLPNVFVVRHQGGPLHHAGRWDTSPESSKLHLRCRVRHNPICIPVDFVQDQAWENEDHFVSSQKWHVSAAVERCTLARKACFLFCLSKIKSPPPSSTATSSRLAMPVVLRIFKGGESEGSSRSIEAGIGFFSN